MHLSVCLIFVLFLHNRKHNSHFRRFVLIVTSGIISGEYILPLGGPDNEACHGLRSHFLLLRLPNHVFFSHSCQAWDEKLNHPLADPLPMSFRPMPPSTLETAVARSSILLESSLE
jgi:hypothetical protein